MDVSVIFSFYKVVSFIVSDRPQSGALSSSVIRDLENKRPTGKTSYRNNKS